MLPESPTHTIHHAEALQWLREAGRLSGCSLVTSLPDFSEFPGMSFEGWKSWFISAATRVLLSTPDDGVAIFYQTDLKREGAWVDKAYLCQKAAEDTGHTLLWHKMVCRAQPGTVTFGRPGYSHLLCFSKGIKAEISISTPDVLPLAGPSTWTRGMGERACELACRSVLEQTSTRTIVDPFCGHGLILKVANRLGLNAIGVDLSRKCVKKARALIIDNLDRPAV